MYTEVFVFGKYLIFDLESYSAGGRGIIWTL